MKAVLQDGRRCVLRFDKGDEIFSGLGEFFREQQISACAFTGIGTCSEIELGFYNSALKLYRKKLFYENLEIISFIGNGGVLDGVPAVHAHGMFGRTDFTVFGGHVFKLIALATCEIFLIRLDGMLERKNNPDFNLNLLV